MSICPLAGKFDTVKKDTTGDGVYPARVREHACMQADRVRVFLENHPRNLSYNMGLGKLKPHSFASACVFNLHVPLVNDIALFAAFASQIERWELGFPF